MSLTPIQFKLRITPETEQWMRAVHSFLGSHPDLAYNEDELAIALQDSVECGRRSLASAMHELTYLGGVDARDHDGQTYYRYLDPIPEFE